MAKGNNVTPSNGGSGGVFDSLKGVVVACLIGGIAIGSAYGAGRRVSDTVIRATNKERKKGEKDRRRAEKGWRREARYRTKLERIKAETELLRASIGK